MHIVKISFVYRWFVNYNFGTVELGELYFWLLSFLIFSTNFDFVSFRVISHVKWVHCHHGMARPRVAHRGDGLQIWRVAANILNKQSRTADSGWYSSLGVGRGANNPPP
jgi:hypothetical protein